MSVVSFVFTSTSRTASRWSGPVAKGRSLISVEWQVPGRRGLQAVLGPPQKTNIDKATYPTRMSVLKLTNSASWPATLFCIACTILSSVTASATWSFFRLEIEDDEGRATCPRGSTRFRRGIAINANFRGTLDRFTMKTSQENGEPTSTRRGPENEIVTPTSVTEYARSRRELRFAVADPG